MLTDRLLCYAVHLPPLPGGRVAVARQPYQDPVARHDIGLMDVKCHHCDALHWIGEKTARSSTVVPEFGLCCDHGQVQLPLLQPPPEPLLQLFERDDRQGNEFREHIWQYNIALSFTSLGVEEDKSVNRNHRGPPIFRIHGALCHRSGALFPAAGREPIYSQLYIYEPRAALDHRMRNNGNLRRDTMELLQDVLHNHNPYARIYNYAHEVLNRYPDAEDVSVRLRVSPSLDRRRYNLPTADEVAVILPSNRSATDPRDIILHRRDGPLQRISDLHPAYTPLHYVLLFPRGENGWHSEMRLHQPDREHPKRLTQTRHAAFRLQSRTDEFSCLLQGGRLLQRWMVDMWASADQNRLNFLRHHQSDLRAALYSGLEDAIGGDDEVDLNELGQRYVLPSSYIGGPRHMQQRFQDSMAIARHYRKVDIFMTVTANPKWPEITRELLPGQTAYDRPDLVSRVFKLKKEAILDDIYKKGVLGQAVAYVYAIEFQKRGLPHMHLLIFLKEPWKLLTPNAIDSVIWARWPDPVTQPLLFQTVHKCMVHGPCGAANPNAPCMENGRCTKRFPKPFQASTTMGDDGFPLYYRPDDGRAFQVGELMIDNSWIVPYSPYFSAKYDCHINVECAVSLGSFKYVFKYIYKGGDRASLEVNRRDEIQRFIDGRYISASEAAWRIFHFDIHDQIPAVVRLQVHLPGQHMVTFSPNDDSHTVLERAAHERTRLTAFFDANADNGPLGILARQYTYQEFPQFFVWNDAKDKKCWTIRKQNFAIGRMYFVPPTAGERFYLRTLLTVVKGPRSFQDLRSYNGTIYPSFEEACLARGLLEDDGEWRQCLAEAAEMQTGSQLRRLFSTLLLFCEPSRPAVLWADFRHHICDDLRQRLQVMGIEQPAVDDIYDFGLFLLNKLLQDSGRSLAEWHSMPQPQQDWDAQAENPLIAEQLNYNRAVELQRAEENLAGLNAEQRQAYDRVIHSVTNDRGELFFLTGAGGTGKTHVYGTICHKVRGEAWVVLCVSSTGISALLMKGGRTSHSMFKIPIDGLNDESFCSIPKESMRANLIRITKLIVWDEVNPQHRNAYEAVDRTCRDLRNDPRPFGGITVVFGGDFQQILPVIPRGSREEIVDSTLQRSYLWRKVQILHLRQNMRLEQGPEEQDFANWLLDVGHGRDISNDGTIALPTDMTCQTIPSLIDFIYPGIGTQPPPPPEYFLDRAILAPRNADVADINHTVLDRMTGDVRTYFSADKILADENTDPDEDIPVPVEFLRSINNSSLPPGELRLKVGCPLILLRNLASSRGLCNGTRMIVQRMSERVLEVRLIGGDHDGDLALIPRIALNPTDTGEYTFKFRRRQFPVRLAFGMSINKAEGQSVKFVGIDLRVPVFAHGQLYVGLSRATSRRRVKVLLPEGPSRTDNVVYPEVLLD